MTTKGKFFNLDRARAQRKNDQCVYRVNRTVRRKNARPEAITYYVIH